VTIIVCGFLRSFLLITRGSSKKHLTLGFGLLARNGFSDEYACEGIGYDMDA